MAKTRRHKMNQSPRKNRQVKLAAIEQGVLVRSRGVRKVGKQLGGVPREATPTFIGRVYTAVNKGKTYPEHGKKRGGDAAV